MISGVNAGSEHNALLSNIRSSGSSLDGVPDHGNAEATGKTVLH
jgi:hypothetical protein